jgi:hypothetical protein
LNLTNPAEAIEKKLEAKMEQAAKEGKEYKPIEVSNFLGFQKYSTD